MNPAVSILIPSYNHSRFLAECLGSVRAQTLREWELRLVDDGSSDDSVATARALAGEDPRFHIERNESNLGTYGTLQRALDGARAPLVAVLNSDDLWEPDKLERQRALLQETDAGLCYTLGTQFGPGGEEDVHADWPKDPLQDPLPHLLDRNRILASSVLFRRERLRFETTCRYSGDWVALLEQTWLRPAACVAEPLTRWRVHGANTYTQSPPQMREEIRVREAIAAVGEQWCAGARTWPAIRPGLARNALNLVACHAYFGKRGPALRAAAVSVRLAGGATAWKRLASLALPMRRVRRRLWGSPEMPSPSPDLPPLNFHRP